MGFPSYWAAENILPVYNEDDKPYVHGFYAGDGVANKPIIWLYGDKRNLGNIFSYFAWSKT